MKVVLIYDRGDQWTADIVVKQFKDKTEMIKFVNHEKIGDSIYKCYEVLKEINIIPFEKVTEYIVEP